MGKGSSREILHGHEKVTFLSCSPKRKIGNNFVKPTEIDKD